MLSHFYRHSSLSTVSEEFYYKSQEGQSCPPIYYRKNEPVLTMAVQYHIKFSNKTATAWHAGVYQQLPSFPGKSVVWKVRRLPPQSSDDLSFKLKFGTALTNWDEDENVYSGQQKRDADLGQAYEATMLDGDIPSINTTPTGNASSSDMIQVKNKTSSKLNIGFTIDGDLLVTEDVDGGALTNFKVHPTYYVALYHSVKQGQMVDAGVSTEAVEVAFKDGRTRAKVEVAMVGGKTTLKVVE